MMAEPQVISVINFFWAAFFLFIAVASLKFKIKQAAEGNLRPASILDFAPFIIFFAALMLYETGQVTSISASETLQNAGIIFSFLGFGLYIVARWTLAGAWGTSTSSPSTLVKNGIYAYVRHPMYTAIMIMMVGSTLLSSSAALFVALPFIVVAFYIKSKVEEQILQLIFSEYAYYKAKTKMFLPAIF